VNYLDEHFHVSLERGYSGRQWFKHSAYVLYQFLRYGFELIKKRFQQFGHCHNVDASHFISRASCVLLGCLLCSVPSFALLLPQQFPLWLSPGLTASSRDWIDEAVPGRMWVKLGLGSVLFVLGVS
jgi:hypothetical protein